MSPLKLAGLTALMEASTGRAETIIGLIDGPVALNHPDLVSGNLREISGKRRGACAQANSIACMHGTFVAGVLCARRQSPAPAICPDCTLLLRPIFSETSSGKGPMPSATPETVAAAIIECIDAGVRIINLSAALAQPSINGERELETALDYAARQEVIVVVAAGNQGLLGSSALTRHAWVIPVVACDRRGRPMNLSNLGASLGKRGLSAPGDAITSLGAEGTPLTSVGTSVAAPFVTGAIALLWSRFTAATAAELKFAVTQAAVPRRTTVVPPLLDAWAAYQFLMKTHR